MKTKMNAKTFISVLIILLMMVCTKGVHATNYDTIYLNDVHNAENVYYCPSCDSVMIISGINSNSNTWIYNYHQDTVYNHNDTLTIPSGYSGPRNWDSANLIHKYFYVLPIEITCLGGTITCGESFGMIDHTTYFGPDSISYNWVPLNGLNNANIHEPLANPATTTTYTVTATVNGCVVIDTATVQVNSFPFWGTNSTIVCGNSKVLHTYNNYQGTGTLTYSWLPTTGLNDPASANPLATVNSSQTYIVSVTTDNGCIETDTVYLQLVPMDAPGVCMVGVDSTNKNMIIWNKPLTAIIDSFCVYRETDVTDVYEKIGTVPYDSMCVFIDQFSFPNIQSNKYKVTSKDKCGLESDQGEYHKTMHLAINQGMGTSWNLIWDPYEGFTVSTYKIYRGTTPESLQMIGSTSGGNTQYTDFSAPGGYVYYQIEVISPNICNIYKSNNSSRSNIASNNPNGISENNYDLDLFSIFPNPVNDKINISLLQKSEIEILNADGRVLKSMILDDIRESIDFSMYSAGVYVIKVYNEKGVDVKKFIKQ